jgi:hypothetical protein
LDRRRDAILVAAVALAARLAVVAWAHSHFLPVEDGHYYDVLARRLASGQGYTWLWPDGAITYAAHYPVGYPAILALAYLIGGAAPTAGMVANAALGAAGAVGAYRIADDVGTARWRPLAAGLCVALHPALLAYTPAFMTEGVTASLLLVAGAFASAARREGRESGNGNGSAAWGWIAAAGAAVGIATLVRPPCILLAPVLGLIAPQAGCSYRHRATAAALAAVVALGCVAPWTARNCVRMHRCALVSVNGGWNLFIGVHTETGGWAPLEVPQECATVWDEAAKDTCFERVAEREIAAAPGAWLARAPAKLAMTFDSIGAGGWYLNASNPSAFGDGARAALGAVEMAVCRLLLLVALLVAGLAPGEWPVARKLVTLGGAVAAVTVHAWIGYAALVVVLVGVGGSALASSPVGKPFGAVVVAVTLAIHAVFFGAGRYGLVALPFVAVCAFGEGGDGMRRLLARAAGALQIGRRRHRSGDRRLGPRFGGARREESPSSTGHDAG